MHMDNTLKGTNVEFNKNTKQKIIKINSGYFWVPLRIIEKYIYYFVINTEQSGPDLGLATRDPDIRASHINNRSEPH
jgi:hypothetical protein